MDDALGLDLPGRVCEHMRYACALGSVPRTSTMPTPSPFDSLVFTDLERHGIPLGVAGKLYGAADVRAALAAGFDFVSLGRAAILHHDFPRRVRADETFECRALPVSAETLRDEGLGDAFIEYMRRWKGFVAA